MNFGQIIWAIVGAWLVLYPAIALRRGRARRAVRIFFRVGRAPGSAR